MPIYEYKCKKDHQFEIMQGHSDPAPKECKVCGDKDVVKVVSRSSFHLKGGGWFSSDYKSSNDKTKKTGGSDDSSGSGGSGNTGGGCGSGCGCH